MSQCSLHSYTSSEVGPITLSQTIGGDGGCTTAVGGDQSVASYTTSLSSDTLYWDQENSGNSSRQVTRKNSCSVRSSSSSFRDCQQDSATAIAASIVKPVKSWDNLATAKHYTGHHGADPPVVDGNAFLYEYLDSSEKSSGSDKAFSSSTRNLQHQQRSGDLAAVVVKSSESLLFYSPNLSDASLSQEYINNDVDDCTTNTPTFISDENGRFVAFIPSINHSSTTHHLQHSHRRESSGNTNNQRDKASQTDGNKKLVNIQQIPEITRL